jgi:hypothetical protein
MRCKNLLFLYCHCIANKIIEKLLCAQITEVDADGSPKKDKEKVTEFLTWNISSSLDGTLKAPKTLAPFFSVNTFLLFYKSATEIYRDPTPSL